jgi:hypothetical protein
VCPDESALARVDGGRTLGDVSTVAFLVGAAGGALGLTALVLGGGRVPAGTALPRAQVRFAFSPAGAAMAGTF